MQRNNVKRGKHYNHKKDESFFDLSVIIKYFVLTIVLAVISYGLEWVVIYCCKQSPTGKCGNGILSLYEVHNTGAAFGLFPDQTALIIMASFVALIAMIASVVIFSGKITPTGSSALSILSGGILMNLIERINLGYVIDYISMDFMPNVPVFNMSDIFIVVGAFALIVALFTRR